MKYFLILLIILLISSCKTKFFIGTYESCSFSCSSITLFSDNTFHEASSSCMSSLVINGKWWIENKQLFLKPDIDSGINYDSSKKTYFRISVITWKPASANSIVIDTLRIPAPEYSLEKYKIKKNKLYWQYKNRNNKIKYSNCAYIKLPEDTNKIIIARWKNSVDCEFGRNAYFYKFYYKHFKRPNFIKSYKSLKE